MSPPHRQPPLILTTLCPHPSMPVPSAKHHQLLTDPKAAYHDPAQDGSLTQHPDKLMSTALTKLHTWYVSFKSHDATRRREDKECFTDEETEA